MKTDLGIYYRAACIMHTWFMEIAKNFTPLFLTATELMIIGALYTAFRLNMGLLLTVALIAFAFSGLFTVKFDFTFATKITEMSISFKQISCLEQGKLNKENQRFLKSCRPIQIKIGNAFTVTRQNFPTIFQDIILANLVNLLVVY